MNRILFNVRWQSTLLAASITHQAAYKNGESDNSENDDRFSSAVARSSKMVLRKMEEVGAPGMVVAVSINGKTVWSQGFGRSDVENNVKCHSGTKMRVASISKCFTAVAMAKLCEDGLLDVDKPIHDYLPDYPPMKYDNKEVKVTLRQLLSHVAGVRHYLKEDDPKTSDFKADQSEKLSTKHYPSVTKALEMFKNDALVNNPEDNSFLYTTHGYTLVSAVMEKATGKNFLRLMKDLFLLIGMDDTVPDLNDRIIYDRSRCYQRKNGKLLNSPYVDLSYKWAGGGFISTVGDILKFGNALLYSYQPPRAGKNTKSLLKQDSVCKLWSCLSKPSRGDESSFPPYVRYGMGWYVCPSQNQLGCCSNQPLEVSHTGGAIGASSVLVLYPDANIPISNSSSEHTALTEFPGAVCTIDPIHTDVPNGVCVAIITNIEGIGLTQLARSIAQEFIKPIL